MNLYTLTRKEVFVLAEKVQCSKHNLYNISLRHKQIGTGLAKRINEADHRFKLSDLRPDIWGN